MIHVNIDHDNKAYDVEILRESFRIFLLWLGQLILAICFPVIIEKCCDHNMTSFVFLWPQSKNKKIVTPMNDPPYSEDFLNIFELYGGWFNVAFESWKM